MGEILNLNYCKLIMEFLQKNQEEKIEVFFADKGALLHIKNKPQ